MSERTAWEPLGTVLTGLRGQESPPSDGGDEHVERSERGRKREERGVTRGRRSEGDGSSCPRSSVLDGRPFLCCSLLCHSSASAMLSQDEFSL